MWIFCFGGMHGASRAQELVVEGREGGEERLKRVGMMGSGWRKSGGDGGEARAGST